MERQTGSHKNGFPCKTGRIYIYQVYQVSLRDIETYILVEKRVLSEVWS